MELAVAPKRAIVVAKILRNQGSFEEVRNTFEGCPLLPSDIHRYQIICGRADTHIDLVQSDQAREILRPGIELLPIAYGSR